MRSSIIASSIAVNVQLRMAPALRLIPSMFVQNTKKRAKYLLQIVASNSNVATD